MSKTALTWLCGASFGAGAMLLLDPARGRRRRALLRDRLAHARRVVAHAAAVTGRDLNHRVAGTLAEARARTTHQQPDDEVLAGRVRTMLGRCVSHPHAIKVAVQEGLVLLEGPILAREVDGLIHRVSRVPGVLGLESRLEAHETTDGVSSLQGGNGFRRPRSIWMQGTWSPTARLMAGAGGVGLVAWGMRHGRPVGAATLAAGTGLLARSLTNVELRRLAGLSGRRAIDVQKTIIIAAPVQEVFNLWRHYENFPRFMRHVREVQDLGGGRSRWTVDGPGGVPVHWDAEVTRIVADELIAWKSVDGASIAHAGVVRFEPTAVGTTRLTIRLSYNPVAGMAGHGVAWLFGADPKHQLDSDLVRMKTLIEEGVVAHDAARRDPGFVERYASERTQAAAEQNVSPRA